MDAIPIILLTTIKSLVALINTIPERFPEWAVIEILSKISGQPSPKHEKINSVLSFLKCNFSEQYSLEEIAAKVGMSPIILLTSCLRSSGFRLCSTGNSSGWL